MNELKPCPFCGSKKAMVLNILEEFRCNQSMEQEGERWDATARIEGEKLKMGKR